MPTTVTIEVKGLRELGEAMRELSSDMANRVARQATGAAAQVVRSAVKQRLLSNPTVDTGLLEKNVITKKVPKSRTQLTSEHVVTVRKKDYPNQRGKSRRNTRQVAMYTEFGTVRKPGGEPFMRPGFETSKMRALDKMVDRLRQRINAVRPK